MFGYDTLSNAKWMDTSGLFLYHGMKDRIISYNHSVVMSKRYQVKLRLSSYGHVDILGDKEMWNDIHLNISSGVQGNKV